MYPLFISLVIVASTLFILFINVGFTGMFTDARPRGDQAMGLAVPILTLPVAIGVLTLGALLCVGRVSASAMGAIVESSPMASGVCVVGLTLGVGLGAGIAFVLWCEPTMFGEWLKRYAAPLGLVTGVGGPVVLAGLLLTGVWMSKGAASELLASEHTNALALKALFRIVVLLAFVGYALGGAFAWKGLKLRAENRAARIAQILADEAKWEALRNRPNKQRITEEFATFSETTPLWYILVYLLDQPQQPPLDDECRAMVVERALQVPDFDAQLERCLKTQYFIYRTAAALFLVVVPGPELERRRDLWGRGLVGGIDATSEELKGHPTWLADNAGGVPEPFDHVATLLKAVERFKGWGDYPELQERLGVLANSARALNADAHRERLVKMLADAGYRASSSPA